MYKDLPEAVVKVIQDQVDEIRKEYHIINYIIREEIFRILDKLCVVLRYPLEDDEEANGLHVQRYVNGCEKHFVFINTSNSIAKQVYTAAHELGHVWEIDKKVISRIGKDECNDSEAIINRFAAELLMPKRFFTELTILKCKELDITSGPVDYKDFLNVIVFLMDIFLVPYKSVVYRMQELKFIDREDRIKLEEIETKEPQEIDEKIKAGNYLKLRQKTYQKSMGNLYEMLRIAKENELVSAKKVSNICRKFDIEFVESTDESSETAISLKLGSEE